MMIRKKYAANDCRYSSPWVARIKEWQPNRKPKLQFCGQFLRDGSGGGVLQFEVSVADVIRIGQKEKAEDEYFVVLEDERIEKLSELEAYELYQALFVQSS